MYQVVPQGTASHVRPSWLAREPTWHSILISRTLIALQEANLGHGGFHRRTSLDSAAQYPPWVPAMLDSARHAQPV